MRNIAELKKLIIKLERPFLILVSAFGLTMILMNLEFNLLEANLYDLRMARGVQSHAEADIVLVAIDDATTKQLNQVSPLPLDLHARLMEAVERYHPRAVGYLVDMNRANELSDEPSTRSQWASRFVQAAQRMEARGIPTILGTPFDVTGEVLPPYPLSALPHSLAVIHKDGNVFAEDKITRRAMAYLYDKPVFHLDLAQRLGMAQAKAPSGSFYVPEVDGQFFFFRYHGNPALSSKRTSAYQRVSFVEILENKIPTESLAGKILLVGTISKQDAGDYALTPYSKNSFSNPKLVIHANILDSVIHDDGIVRAPDWLNWLTTFTVAALVLWWVLTSTPLYGVFFTLLLAAVFGILAQALFSVRGLWIRGSQPLVGIFLGYYLAVPYRLIVEYKKRWEYQRKNELLVQVEELKTNFLSLVTHDLKTPVARIQGLAEVLLNKASERLQERDKDTIQHIIVATEELNRFISSILELNKVDSNRIKLVLESKDVNQLIERAVEQFKAQARAADIQINTNLEPLFPIKIDPTLISKVINNLIDNAMKYSHSGSAVFIESRETGDWVEISIRDEGIGMTQEERQLLFTRFYRVKNDTTTQIAGTGLGLYLTRYFIEAHHGRVEVESEKGKGSTFKILLPIAENVATVTSRPQTKHLRNLLGFFKFPKLREKENADV